MPATLRITAGPTPTALTPLPINTPDPTALTPTTSTHLHIHNFHGHPPSPSTTPLLPPSDLFTLTFTLTPTAPIRGDRLHLSNHLPRSLPRKLPYFFPAAWKALTLFDPALSGDVYAAQPWVSSPVLSSFTRIRISRASDPPPGLPVVEDMRLAGVELEEGARRRFFLSAEKRRAFEFKVGWRCELAFGNALIDFAGLAVVVPGLGWRVGVLRFYDGVEGVRFVLGGERGEEVLGVVEVNVDLGEEGGEEGEVEEFDVKEAERLGEGGRDDDID